MQLRSVNERRRAFSRSKSALGPGAQAPVFEESQTNRTYRVCDACADAIDAGADPHALRGKRAARQILIVCLVLLAIALATPIILPHLMSALWLQ